MGLSLEHNGDLYSCDHFIEPDYMLDNVMDEEITELASSESQYRFGKNERDSLPQV